MIDQKAILKKLLLAQNEEEFNAIVAPLKKEYPKPTPEISAIIAVYKATHQVGLYKLIAVNGSLDEVIEKGLATANAVMGIK